MLLEKKKQRLIATFSHQQLVLFVVGLLVVVEGVVGFWLVFVECVGVLHVFVV